MELNAVLENGVRVSANMVVTKDNKHRVFETGKLMAELVVVNFLLPELFLQFIQRFQKITKIKKIH